MARTAKEWDAYLWSIYDPDYPNEIEGDLQNLDFAIHGYDYTLHDAEDCPDAVPRPDLIPVQEAWQQRMRRRRWDLMEMESF